MSTPQDITKIADLNIVIEAGNYRYTEFHGEIKDLRRFCNRYRVANAFSSLSLEGYQSPTENGYSHITKTFLVWSAFEKFWKITNLNKAHLHVPLFDPVDYLALSRVIRQHDPNYELIKYLKEEADNWLKTLLQKFIDGDDDEAIYVAAGIRHIFAHGTLTANPAGCVNTCIPTICDAINTFLLDHMNQDFSRKITAFQNL